MTRQCYEEGMAAMLVSHGITRFTTRELCAVGRSTGATGGVILEAPPAVLWPNIIPAVKIAQEAREHFDEPMRINSGYRSPAYNRAIGSTSRRHVEFFALDVCLERTSTRELYDWLEAHPMADKMGLGYYPTFVHMDVMGRKSRWGDE